ncbi:site-specific integrase [Paenibacillus pasadenensis]|uniref:site-specific integrase n=1 Tax=Paenibacillus pasadenensis TaxID=217090 RepID=UPI002041C102|nr:site-specific integrase [Paenibacillus pasadenensis]MCM3746571.1 site-specific integrase [Paenibacillus pasadenensis]
MARVEKRGKGTYRLLVEGGRDATGKRIRHTKTIKARNGRDAEVELAKFVTEIEAGTYISPEKMTFFDFIKQEWTVKYAVNLAASTQHIYNTYLDAYILPKVGHLRLCDISTIQLVNVMHEFTLPRLKRNGKTEPLSQRTQSYIYNLLFSVLEIAKKWRLIPINPMEGVIRPKVDRKKMEVYHSQEAAAVIEALLTEPRRWRLLIIGALVGGCRRGEKIAVEWSDVSFSTHEISINRSITLRKKGIIYETAPKTESSIRIVKMPEWYMAELADFRKEWLEEKLLAGKDWKGGNRQYIFHRGYGVPYHPGSATKWWNRFVKRHGFKKIRFHDLRHSSASILFEQGARMKEIQLRLGHKNESTTSKTYVHLTQEMVGASADRLEFLAPKKKSGEL